jgi:LacI family transcriptional regulator
VSDPSDVTVKTRRARTRPSLRDVAERAEVAVSTAGRVMAGSPNVRPVVRERVLAAAAELGYESNLLARSPGAARACSSG